MKKNKQIYVISSFLLLLVMIMIVVSLMRSNDKYQDLKVFMKEIGEAKTTEVEPIPDFKLVTVVKYNPGMKRSPFDKKSINEQAVQDKMIKKKTLGILQQYALSSLSLVGIVNLNGTLWGILEGPDGNAFRVTVGDPVGNENLEIVRIKKSSLTLALVKDSTWDEKNGIEMHISARGENQMSNKVGS